MAKRRRIQRYDGLRGTSLGLGATAFLGLVIYRAYAMNRLAGEFSRANEAAGGSRLEYGFGTALADLFTHPGAFLDIRPRQWLMDRVYKAGFILKAI